MRTFVPAPIRLDNSGATFDLPWYRLAVFWHFYFSCPQRSAIAAFAFLIFWLALILRRLGMKRVTGTLAGLSLLVWIIFATSAAASWQMENSARRFNLNPPPAIAPTNTPVTPPTRG